MEVRSPARPVPANLRISIWFVHQVSKGKQPTFSTNAVRILERPEEGSPDLLMEERMGRRDGTVDARHDDDPSSASNVSLHGPARRCIHRWFYTTLGLSEPTMEDPSLMSDLPDEPTDANIMAGLSSIESSQLEQAISQIKSGNHNPEDPKQRVLFDLLKKDPPYLHALPYLALA